MRNLKYLLIAVAALLFACGDSTSADNAAQDYPQNSESSNGIQSSSSMIGDPSSAEVIYSSSSNVMDPANSSDGSQAPIVESGLFVMKKMTAVSEIFQNDMRTVSTYEYVYDKVVSIQEFSYTMIMKSSMNDSLTYEARNKVEMYPNSICTEYIKVVPDSTYAARSCGRSCNDALNHYVGEGQECPVIQSLGKENGLNKYTADNDGRLTTYYLDDENNFVRVESGNTINVYYKPEKLPDFLGSSFCVKLYMNDSLYNDNCKDVEVVENTPTRVSFVLKTESEFQTTTTTYEYEYIVFKR